MLVNKVAFIGAPMVGKTTLIRLLTGENLPKEYQPTIGLDFGKIVLGQNEFSLWDLAGQEQFAFLWEIFLKGTKLIFAVTDSTPKNVLLTKELIRKTKKCCQRLICIANKQDLPGALKPEEIERQLKVETYGMKALDPEYRAILELILQQ
ncbi:MAG: ADP-ribosylation factor-like protein [Promethearchaeota archaeon]